MGTIVKVDSGLFDIYFDDQDRRKDYSVKKWPDKRGFYGTLYRKSTESKSSFRFICGPRKSVHKKFLRSIEYYLSPEGSLIVKEPLDGDYK